MYRTLKYIGAISPVSLGTGTQLSTMWGNWLSCLALSKNNTSSSWERNIRTRHLRNSCNKIDKNKFKMCLYIYKKQQRKQNIWVFMMFMAKTPGNNSKLYHHRAALKSARFKLHVPPQALTSSRVALYRVAQGCQLNCMLLILNKEDISHST